MPETDAASADYLEVEASTHRRTALVALRGELDLVTVSKVAEVLEESGRGDGVRHIVLDLRGLTFMDVPALRELIRQNEYARSNRHNLAVVRGTAPIDKLLSLTGVEEMLVLVDDPDDLAPPTWTAVDDSEVYANTLPAEARNVGTLRRGLSHALQPLDISVERSADIVLVVSEALSNVTVHAYVGMPLGPVALVAALSAEASG